jgi:hypothetical protein
MRILKCLAGLIKKGCLVVAAFVCFVSIFVLVFVFKDAASGTLMAGLFVVLVLMHSIPEMESFKAFSIEAKWQTRLTKADQILASLSATLAMFGKLTYHMFGWGSRMSHPIREKQRLADELDRLLRANGVSEQDVVGMKERYIYFCLYDINQALQRAKERLAIDQARKWGAQAAEAQLMDAGAMKHPELRAKQERLLQYNQQNRQDFPTQGFHRWCMESVRQANCSNQRTIRNCGNLPIDGQGRRSVCGRGALY